jgi:hypothetical protein
VLTNEEMNQIAKALALMHGPNIENYRGPHRHLLDVLQLLGQFCVSRVEITHADDVLRINYFEREAEPDALLHDALSEMAKELDIDDLHTFPIWTGKVLCRDGEWRMLEELEDAFFASKKP